MRDRVIEYLESELTKISKANGYHTDFAKVSYWQDTSTEYSVNHLDYKDLREDYEKNNGLYKASLHLSITAIVVEGIDTTAPKLGNLALEDLISCMREFSYPGCFCDIIRSHKYVETKGKTACCIELEALVKYKF